LTLLPQRRNKPSFVEGDRNMPIIVATAPPQSIQILNSTIQNWMNHPTTSPRQENSGINFAAENGIDIHLPHPVYNLSLTDLALGKGLAASKLVAWRYVLSDGDSAVLAEVSQPRHAGQTGEPNAAAAPALSMINRGPFVSSLVQTVDAAGKNPALQSGSYEIAVLSIPALYVMALWLRSKVAGGGSLIPLAPTDPALVAGQTYTEAVFLQALTPVAQRSMQIGEAARA
jgi:hypothetical protein